MEPIHYWFVAGLVLVGLELLTLELSFASFALGSFAGGFATWMGYHLPIQAAFFAVISLISFIGVRPVFKNYLIQSSSKRPHGIHALIGKSVLVTEVIENSQNRGRVQIDGENWKARSSNGEKISKDQNVLVERIEGATAYVKKL